MKECKYNDKLLKQIIYRQELRILILKMIATFSISLISAFSIPMLSVTIPEIGEIFTQRHPTASNVSIVFIIWIPCIIAGFWFFVTMWEKAWDKFDEATK